MDCIDIVYQFNDKYAPYAGVSITSLITNNQGFCIRFHILGENLSEINIKKLKSFEDSRITVLFYDTKEIIDNMQQMDLPAYRNSYAANLRMFLPYLLDQSIKKVLYLDADTIVLKDIKPLFEKDLDFYCVAMVLDSLAAKHGKMIGLGQDDFYFNSGIILFDLENWKKEKCTERIIEHVKNVRAYYPSPDQDLLNIVCRNKIMCLPIEYNFQPIHKTVSVRCYQRTFIQKRYYSEKEINSATEKMVILHCFRFLGEFPWHENNMHPFLREFDKYLLISPWKDYKKMKADCGLILKVEKAIFKILPRDVFGYIFYLMHSLFIFRADKMAQKNQINKLM